MFITNFNIKDLEKYQLAITEFKRRTGSNRLTIKEKAYNSLGELMSNTMALHDAISLYDTKENKDLTLFWNIYDDIEKNGNSAMLENMQYYMEYCLSNGYVTPIEWLSKHKHF